MALSRLKMRNLCAFVRICIDEEIVILAPAQESRFAIVGK